ncbi:GNAT family N-acetyltransferase [Streptacidiphilus rugosus]|uniref:GNAT family N-acetyltransferase n=1 Tax=Streptacidiphilus rugosus TaxID=405783 RepID=UPI00056822C2|nr:GNAT family N-acetyltransferase [Streptacidiphilus rugosus]
MRDHLEIPGGPGLSLRRWRAVDAGAVLTAFADPLMAAQAVDPVDSLAAAERWIAGHDARWASDAAFAFAVVDDGGRGQVLGSVAVGAVDRRHATGWVSYWTTAEARGRGVASAACRTVADWAFADAGLFRLELGHRVDNPASCRVATSAGFSMEGLERQKLQYDGVRYDVELHARLATD